MRTESGSAREEIQKQGTVDHLFHRPLERCTVDRFLLHGGGKPRGLRDLLEFGDQFDAKHLIRAAAQQEKEASGTVAVRNQTDGLSVV